MKKVIIIPKKETNIKKYSSTFGDNLGHETRYKHFIKINNLQIESPVDVGYKWGEVLALHGFLNCLVQRENLICFVPNDMSDNQYKWLLNNYFSFARYNLSAVIITYIDGEIKYLTTEDKKDFYKKIKKIYKGDEDEYSKINIRSRK